MQVRVPNLSLFSMPKKITIPPIRQLLCGEGKSGWTGEMDHSPRITVLKGHQAFHCDFISRMERDCLPCDNNKPILTATIHLLEDVVLSFVLPPSRIPIFSRTKQQLV